MVADTAKVTIND